jgi:hypothetical protein
VLSASLTGSTKPQEWLGFAAHRTLLLTVRNSGTLPTPHLALLADIGSTPASIPKLPGLAPGETRTYAIPVTFPALAFGNTAMAGHIGVIGSGTPLAPFHVSISRHPWAWLVIFLIVFQVILLMARNVARRHYERNNPTNDDLHAPMDEQLPVQV